MEFLGIGPLELVFIVLIALIILGPKDMIRTGRAIGRFLRKTILSPSWLSIQRKMRNLPVALMREAGLNEEDLKMKPEDFGISKDDLGVKPEDLNINIDPKVSSPAQPQSLPTVSPVPAATVAPPKPEPKVEEQIPSAIPVEEFAVTPEHPGIESSNAAEIPTPGIEQPETPAEAQETSPAVIEQEAAGILQSPDIIEVPKQSGVPEIHASENPNGSSGSHHSESTETDRIELSEADRTTEPEQS